MTTCTPLEELLSAWDDSDLVSLVAVLDPRVTLTVDSGDAAGRTDPVSGPWPVASVLFSLRDGLPGCSLSNAEVNGAPGIVIRSSDRVVGVVAVAQHARTVTQLWIVTNPTKLTHWNRG